MPEDRATYPTFTIKHWWALRDVFKRSIPPVITSDYIQTALNLNTRSAEVLIPALKSVGIIDADRKPQERAKKWRDDETYADVCAEIRNEIYPEELLHAAPGPTVDRTVVQRWFGRKTGSGEGATAKMANYYQLLWEADPTKKDQQTRPSPATKGKPKVTKASASPKRPPHTPVEEIPKVDSTPSPQLGVDVTPVKEAISLPKNAPSLHINIQIHISPESSPDQLDQIFASMAKHFKDLT